MNSIDFRLFDKLSSSVKLQEIKEKIKLKEYDNIEWFDLESEIYKKFPNLSSEKYEYIEYLLQQQFIKNNSNIVNGYDKDLINFTVLQDICDDNLSETSRSDLVKKEYMVESSKTSAIVDKTLNLFELYGVVEKKKLKYLNNKSVYSIDLDKWYKKSKYHIQDYDLLSKLSPVITSFINIGFVKTFNIQNLFVKLSEVIEYAIRPSVYHNLMKEIEEEILINMEQSQTIDISFENKDGDIKYIELLPLKIIYKKGEKFVLGENIATKKKVEVALFDLKDNIDIHADYHSSIKPKNISTFSINEPTIIQEESKNIEVILECDSLVYEYFQMKPLSNMEIYDDEDKLKEFSEKYHIESLKNKFYVVANDSEDMIISTVLHTLNNVKILSPNNLNDKLANMFENYLNKTNIDICKDNNPPSPSDINTESKKTPKGISEEDVKKYKIIKDNDIEFNV